MCMNMSIFVNPQNLLPTKYNDFMKSTSIIYLYTYELMSHLYT